jgi:hypothetical protein
MIPVSMPPSAHQYLSLSCNSDFETARTLEDFSEAVASIDQASDCFTSLFSMLMVLFVVPEVQVDGR